MIKSVGKATDYGEYMLHFLYHLRKEAYQHSSVKEEWLADIGVHAFKSKRKIFFLADMERFCVSVYCCDQCKSIIRAKYAKLIVLHPYLNEKRMLSILIPNRESSLELILSLFDIGRSCVIGA